MSRTNFKLNFLTMAGAFVGGLITGFLLTSSPDGSDRIFLRNKAGRFSDWISERKDKTEKKVRQITSTMGKSVNGKLPDLYSATEDLHLTDEDLIN